MHLVEELQTSELFREIAVERLEDTHVDANPALEERLRALLAQLADHTDDASEVLHLILGQSSDAAELTNLLGAHVCSDHALRRRMLECVNVETRLRMSCQHMGRLLLEFLEAPAGGRDTLHSPRYIASSTPTGRPDSADRQTETNQIVMGKSRFDCLARWASPHRFDNTTINGGVGASTNGSMLQA